MYFTESQERLLSSHHNERISDWSFKSTVFVVIMQASDEETVSQSPSQETPYTCRDDAHDQVVRGQANLIIRSDCIQL